MAAESSMKPAEENDGIHRLSNLPEPLMCHILSFLPIRISVATMPLVSRQWRYLWKHVHEFDFEDDDVVLQTFQSFKRFAVFVTALLARKSGHIRKLNLGWDFSSDGDEKFQVDCAQMWIRAAIGPNLQELFFHPLFIEITLPPSFFKNCTNLVSLSLGGGINMNVPNSSVHFPSMKMLTLDTVHNTVDSVATLLAKCPRLETLGVYFCYTQEVPIPTSSSSKRLKSINDNFTWTYFDIYFHMDNEDIKLGIIGNFHNMMEAFLDVFSPSKSEFVDPVLKNHRDDEDELRLLLRHSSSKWPPHAPVLNYPEFCDLNHLKFILPCFNSNLLVNVLEKCRMLQVLVIQSNKDEPLPSRTWQPESTTVSECLKSHLTYVRIEGYQGLEDELTFVEYILWKGLVLKTVLIFIDSTMDKTDKDDSIKRLNDIPRGSLMCQLKFDTVVSS